MIEVVAAVIIDPTDHVILGRRKPHGKYAGKIDFPGGKVEPGEAFRVALARELEEELGIQADPEEFETLGTFKPDPSVLIEGVNLTLYAVRNYSGEPKPIAYAELVRIPLDIFRTLGDFINYDGLQHACRLIKHNV